MGKVKHGLANTRLYGIWTNMKTRCYNPNSERYNTYGGRGITVCNEWLSDFTNFYNWSIENGYTDELSIDRINADGDYEPNNCRWITMKEQGFNKTTSHFVTICGVTKNIQQWENETGINHETLVQRIELGWDEKDLLKPVRTAIQIECNEQTYTFEELANETGLSLNTLYDRYFKMNLRNDDLIKPASYYLKKQLITINGETKPIKEWSKITGLKTVTIRKRLEKGLQNDDLIAPLQTKFYTYNDKTQTLPEWSRELNISYSRLDNRLKKGMAFEEIINYFKDKGEVII